MSTAAGGGGGGGGEQWAKTLRSAPIDIGNPEGKRVACRKRVQDRLRQAGGRIHRLAITP
jgi:hypothetical protein